MMTAFTTLLMTATLLVLTGTALSAKATFDDLNACGPGTSCYDDFVRTITTDRRSLLRAPIPTRDPNRKPIVSEAVFRSWRELVATVRALLAQAATSVPFTDLPLRYAAWIWGRFQRDPNLADIRSILDDVFGWKLRQELFNPSGPNKDYLKFAFGNVVPILEQRLNSNAAVLLLAIRIMTATSQSSSPLMYRVNAQRRLSKISTTPIVNYCTYVEPKPIVTLLLSHCLLFSPDWIQESSNAWNPYLFGVVSELLLDDPQLDIIYSGLENEPNAAPESSAWHLQKQIRDRTEPVLGSLLYPDQRYPVDEYTAVAELTPAFKVTDQVPTYQLQRLRYRDMRCNDERRVRLQKFTEYDYINADRVQVLAEKPSDDFIATQAPKPQTIGDFWQMIWQEKTPLIVMLVSMKEGPMKVDNYWSSGKADAAVGDVLALDNGLQVTLIAKDEPLPDTIGRTFEVRDGQNPDQTLIVRHLEYTGWADMSVPTMESFGLLYDKFDAERVQIQDDGRAGPIVVHCSAGVGRTGTFMAIDMALKGYKGRSGQVQYGIQPIVTHLRKMRRGCVQNEAQYAFIYEFVSNRLFGRHMF